ncbi:MAG TPA: hypothetical protein PK661_08355 [Syntrophorhabdaceae bacterium]|nr:hypothetical protein [Syntrophorhabdaceae bacterium]MDI9560225.1 hypothetical protein [Pseudomonadota bacterium]HOS60095.1 hypothetical protein [Syntrophorhabdaceae bacterium]
MKVTLIVALVLFTTLQAHALFAKDLGVFGKTYNIVEPDALEEIKKQATKVDWKKAINKNKILNSAKSFKLPDLKKIRTAKKERTFTVDMTYTLNFDITDAGGNIIYPRGYRFNPLDHINYNKTLVIINAAVPKQIEWLASSSYAKEINTMVLITDGSYYDIMKRLKRPVYYANTTLLERFQVVAVPAVVRQYGNTMQVKEIPPEKTSNAKKG